MGHNEIPENLGSSLPPASFLRSAFFFQRRTRRAEARVYVCFHAARLRIQAQMRRDKLLHPPLRSSVVGPSALPFSSSFQHSLLLTLFLYVTGGNKTWWE